MSMRYLLRCDDCGKEMPTNPRRCPMESEWRWEDHPDVWLSDLCALQRTGDTMSLLCADCGQPQHEHHEFRKVNRPDGCVCEAGEWGDPANLPPVCFTYKGHQGGDGSWDVCDTCEHDRACHNLEVNP